MPYDIELDQANADPKHCNAVLREEKQSLEKEIFSVVKQFIDRTNLKVISISVLSTPDCCGDNMLFGINIQLDI